MNISHSKLNTYKECGQKYFYKYVEKYESIYLPSPLLFGIAIDEALNNLLSKESTLNIQEVFTKVMSENDGKDITSGAILDISAKDISLHLLDKYHDEFTMLPDFKEVCTGPLSHHTEYIKTHIKPNFAVFKRLGWLSLYEKGLILVGTYQNVILPYLMTSGATINSVQDKLEIDNGDGDKLVCKPDFNMNMLGSDILKMDKAIVPRKSLIDPNKNYLIIMDNKTAGKLYDETSVRTSDQLATYSEFYDTNMAGYVVLHKEVKKNRSINWQIIIDFVDEKKKEEVFDNFSEGLYNIKNEVYEKDLGACFKWGRKCEYYDLCYNGNADKLRKRT